MKSLKLFVYTFVLVFLGALCAFLLFTDSGEKLLFFIAFLAFIYPVLKAIETNEINKKNKKVEMVKGSSPESLAINLNKRLEELKNKSYVEVQITSSTLGFIYYY